RGKGSWTSATEPPPRASGEGAFQSRTIDRIAVRRQHDLHGLVQQRPQAGRYLLNRHTVRQPASGDLEPVAEVDQRIASDHGTYPLAPEHEVELTLAPGIHLHTEQRGANRVARRLDELVLRAIGRRRPHRKPERSGVALVPRGRQYRDHVARSKKRAYVFRDGDGIDED